MFTTLADFDIRFGRLSKRELGEKKRGGGGGGGRVEVTHHIKIHSSCEIKRFDRNSSLQDCV